MDSTCSTPFVLLTEHIHTDGSKTDGHGLCICVLKQNIQWNTPWQSIHFYCGNVCNNTCLTKIVEFNRENGSYAIFSRYSKHYDAPEIRVGDLSDG